MFGTLRMMVLRVKESFNLCIYVFPIIVGSTVTLNTFYIVYKGAKGIGLDEIPLSIACAWSFGLGGCSGLLTVPFVKYYLKPFIENKFSVFDNDKEEFTINNNDIVINGNIEDDRKW